MRGQSRIGSAFLLFFVALPGYFRILIEKWRKI
jgi:hypothetical protein